MNNLIKFSEKLVEMSNNRASKELSFEEVVDVCYIFGLTDNQRDIFNRIATDAFKNVFENEKNYTHDILEYVYAVLESKLR